MKISQLPIGSKVVCCGATAEVLNTGAMGTRVNVLTVPDVSSGFPLGKQIWSNLSDVELVTEYASGFDNSTKSAIKPHIANKPHQCQKV